MVRKYRRSRRSRGSRSRRRRDYRKTYRRKAKRRKTSRKKKHTKMRGGSACGCKGAWMKASGWNEVTGTSRVRTPTACVRSKIPTEVTIGIDACLGCSVGKPPCNKPVYTTIAYTDLGSDDTTPYFLCQGCNIVRDFCSTN